MAAARCRACGQRSEQWGQEPRRCDGEAVSTVHGLISAPLSGHRTRIVVRSGFLTPKEIALPAALIARLDDDVLGLTGTATDVSA